MSDLKMYEKVIFEKLFDRGGSVLDFNNSRFAEFFRENGIDIELDKYYKNGNSKMKRLRTFWEIEPNATVGRVLAELLRYAQTIENIDDADYKNAVNIIDRLLGKKQQEKLKDYKEILTNDNLTSINIEKLNLDTNFQQVIQSRIDEIQNTINNNAPLATIFLCGSVLEGILLDVACRNIRAFNQSQSAPKSKDGKVKNISDWTLENLINVSHSVGIIDLSIKEFSSSLKGFRNYIHPREQIAKKFNPTNETADICCRVLIGAISQIIKNQKKLV